MRVTGGILCGRRIRVPAGWAVRPTEDRVREALFSILGDRIPGARFLDLCGGSGAVGLEALSRGAGAVVWVESSRKVLPVLRENVQQLGFEGPELQVVGGDALRFLEKGLASPVFDVIFADPPYRSCGSHGEQDMLAALLSAVERGRRLSQDGLFVMEESARAVPPRMGKGRKARARRAAAGDITVGESWVLVQERTYGSARLSFFRGVGTGTEGGESGGCGDGRTLREEDEA